MPVTLKLDHPELPDDMVFGIGELGRVQNHGTLEVDDDKVAAFEASRGMSIQEAFANNAIVSVQGAEQQQAQPPQEQEQAPQPTAPQEPTVEAGEQ